MKYLLLFLVMMLSCGDEVIEKHPEACEKLPEGYWVGYCTCQTRPYPGELTRPYSACEGGFKTSYTCENKGVFWCNTGKHWGWKCN